MSEPFVPPRRFPGLVARVNLFLLVAAGLAAGFMALVAYKQGWLIPHSTVHFVAENALGISKGMPVRLHGFVVGSVEDMDLEYGDVDVRLSIDSRHLAEIPKDSKARLARESGVVGAASIDILPGRAQVPLAAGDRLAYEPTRGLSEIIDDLRKQVAPAFTELRQVLAQMDKSSEGMAETMKIVQQEVRGLPETHADLRKALVEADRTLLEVRHAAKSADAAARSARLAVEHVDANVQPLASKLSMTLDSLGATAGDLRRTSEEARETMRQARPTLDRSATAAREATEVFSAAKRIWPIRGSLQQESDPVLPIDSFEAKP